MDAKLISKKALIELIKTEKLSDIVPNVNGLLFLRQGNKIIYYQATKKLAKLCKYLFSREKTDDKITKAIEQSDTVSYIVTEDEFESLVVEKRLMLDNKINDNLKITDHYVYLAVNSLHKPYIRITEHTAGDWFYVGPFTDRFFLIEVIELFAKYENAPACKPYYDDTFSGTIGGVFQIENSDDLACNLHDKCQMYCKTKSSIILCDLVNRIYLKSNKSIIQKMELLYNEYYDNLQFNKADSVKKDLQIFKKYYEHIEFLAVIKNLDDNFIEKDVVYTIKSGMLEMMTENNRTEVFGIDKTVVDKQRKQEHLALPKDSLWEMLSVYKKIKSLNPDLINSLEIKSNNITFNI